MSTTISGEEFLNSVSYDGHLCVLGDHHAPVAVSAAGSDQVGVSQLYLKGLHLGSCEPALQPALRVWLDDGQGWEIVAVTERTAWPWGWRETGRTERTRLVQEVWFAANDRLVVRWQVEPLKPGTPAPRLAVGGAFVGAGMSVAGKTGEDGWEWTIRCSGQNLLFRKPFGFDWQLRLKAGRVMHDAAGLPVVEAAEGGQAFAGEVALLGGIATATLEWSFNGTTAPAAAAPESFAAAETRWRDWLSALPACQPDTRYWRRKRGDARDRLIIKYY
jgi:hypothetical protein